MFVFLKGGILDSKGKYTLWFLASTQDVGGLGPQWDRPCTVVCVLALPPTPDGITKSSTFCLACFGMGKCSIYFLQSLYFGQFNSRHVYHSELFPKHSKSKQAIQKVEDFVIQPIA